MFGKAYRLLKDSGIKFMNDKAPRLGAALAYYTALSLSPLLIVVIAIAGFIFGEEAASGRLSEQIRELVGEQGAKVVEDMLSNHTKASGIVATVVGVVTLVIGATGVFAQLQDALDVIFLGKHHDRVTGGIWASIKDRFLSFSVVCGMAFLLLVSLVFSAVLNALGGWINSWLPYGSVWLSILNAALTLLLTASMFALIFKVLPHAHPSWRDVWIGAVITALLFGLGKYLIGLYLGQAAVGSAYGAAGSFVVLLVWVYYSNQILLFGACFTQIFATRHGRGLKSDGQEKAEQGGGKPAAGSEAKPAATAPGLPGFVRP